MACPSSGTITIQDIVDEFGGSAPHSLSEYYRDGGEVPSNNTNVPTSGTISLSNFYDAVNEIIITVSSGTTNYSCSTAFGSHWTSAVPKRLVINSGVTIGGTGSNPALTIDESMAGTLIVQNAGTLTGYGGAANGGTGGSAVKVLTDNASGITFNNTGSLQAGGGGGGTGGDSGAGGTGGDGGAGGAGGEGGNGTYQINYGSWPNNYSTWSCSQIGGVPWWQCGSNNCAPIRCVQLYGSGVYCTSSSVVWNHSDPCNNPVLCANCAKHSTSTGAAGGAGGAGGSGSGGGAATEGGQGGVGAGYQVSATNGQAGSAAEGVAGSGGSSGQAGQDNGNNSGAGGTGGTGGEGGNGGDSGTSGEGGNGGGLGQAGQAGDTGQDGQTGQTGDTGATGAAGANGNSTNGDSGTAGQSGQAGAAGGEGVAGAAGGQAGYYIENIAYLTLSNSGTVQGRS